MNPIEKCPLSKSSLIHVSFPFSRLGTVDAPLSNRHLSMIAIDGIDRMMAMILRTDEVLMQWGHTPDVRKSSFIFP